MVLLHDNGEVVCMAAERNDVNYGIDLWAKGTHSNGQKFEKLIFSIFGIGYLLHAILPLRVKVFVLRRKFAG